MGLFSPRRHIEVRPEQKWDYISLKDFRSSSCFTAFAYAYVYISLLISIAVYAVDSFTAVQLLVFNTWASSITPTTLISFDTAKWIFSICIIASFVNLAFEHFRAFGVMRRGSVAECYLDNLAVRLESVKMGKGMGWRRFLVFAELTKSKKGAEYIALFTYFSFKTWIRVIFCSGPRQVVNALTLYAVYTSDLIPTSTGDVGTTFLSLFSKIGALAADNYRQAVVLSGMLFTLVIWVFSALSLLLGATFYVFFLWHYIPKQDGGLSGYCERKINKRLLKIVAVKLNKAMAKEEKERAKAELKAAKKAGELPVPGRQATLPTLPNVEPIKKDGLPEMPMLNRNDTMATLPAYTSRPGTPGSIEMSSLDQKRPMPYRQGTSNTMGSQASYSSRAPLVGSAAGMGRSTSPVQRLPTLPQVDMGDYPPFRPGTAQSNRSFGGPLQRTQTGNSSGFGLPYSQSPAPFPPENAPTLPGVPTLPSIPPPTRSATGSSVDSYGRPMPRPGPGPGQFGPRANGTPGPGRPMFDDGMSGRGSPRPGPPGPSQPMFDDGMSDRGTPMPGPPGPGRPMFDDGMSGRGTPRPGPPGPGRQMFDDGMGGRASPRPGPPGPPRPMFDDGMTGRSSPRPGPPGPSRPIYDENAGGRSSPAPSTFSNQGAPSVNGSTYNGPPYHPVRSATNPIAPSQGQQFAAYQPPQRNMTAPLPPRQDEFARPGTANSQRTMPARPGFANNYAPSNDGYDYEQDGQRGPGRQRW
ncbi:hypothetical protein BX600DRAFT_511316 [Xylariales sp. PMI_506]|nr:hypothetical protein BX600DRAFT_511316 [Xylariales sp. PMI_506]